MQQYESYIFPNYQPNIPIPMSYDPQWGLYLEEALLNPNQSITSNDWPNTVSDTNATINYPPTLESIPSNTNIINNNDIQCPVPISFSQPTFQPSLYDYNYNQSRNPSTLPSNLNKPSILQRRSQNPNPTSNEYDLSLKIPSPTTMEVIAGPSTSISPNANSNGIFNNSPMGYWGNNNNNSSSSSNGWPTVDESGLGLDFSSPMQLLQQQRQGLDFLGYDNSWSNTSSSFFEDSGSEFFEEEASQEEVIQQQQRRTSESPSPSPNPRTERLDSTKTVKQEQQEEEERNFGVLEDGMMWGMKAEEYKALNARERKRVRNRLSARIFRQKRKACLGSLRSELGEQRKVIELLRKENCIRESSVGIVAKDQRTNNSRVSDSTVKQQVKQSNSKKSK